MKNELTLEQVYAAGMPIGLLFGAYLIAKERAKQNWTDGVIGEWTAGEIVYAYFDGTVGEWSQEDISTKPEIA